MLSFRDFQVRQDFVEFLVQNQIDLEPFIETLSENATSIQDEDLYNEFLRAALRYGAKAAKSFGGAVGRAFGSEVSSAGKDFYDQQTRVKIDDAKKYVQRLAKTLDEIGVANPQFTKNLDDVFQALQNYVVGATPGSAGSPDTLDDPDATEFSPAPVSPASSRSRSPRPRSSRPRSSAGARVYPPKV